MKILIVAALMLFLLSCKKENPGILVEKNVTPSLVNTYLRYTILKGQHFSDKSIFKNFSNDKMTFKVKFDSSAIYQTVDPDNQYDVNKLYGFSEGNDHHKNSARVGWAWNRNALRLYAYVYGNGVRKIKEITTVAIGLEIDCAISISESEYSFTINKIIVAVDRSIGGPAITGYYLYPYFGGDETAPHDTFIDIRDTPE